MNTEEGGGMVPGLITIAISALFAAVVGYLALRLIPSDIGLG